jgi:mutator protein MutT
MHPLSLFQFCPKCGSSQFVIHNEKAKCCKSCGFIYYANACSATVALVLNQKQELLVSKRAHHPAKGTLDLPGGFIDMDETAEEGLIREIKEETSLDVNHIEYLFSFPNEYEYAGFLVHTVDLFYLCNVNNFHQLSANDDVEELQFIPLSDIDMNDFGLASIRKGLAHFIHLQKNKKH